MYLYETNILGKIYLIFILIQRVEIMDSNSQFFWFDIGILTRIVFRLAKIYLVY